MKARPFDLRRLDLVALCHDGGTLQGEWPAQQLPRLAASALAWDALHEGSPGTVPAEGPPPVVWQARAWLQPVRAGAPERWLELQAQATVALECQRCLQPLRAVLQAQRRLRFVDTEEEAARLDELSEDDVLALPRRLDLRELVEDELILALPIVPRHDTCPRPLPSGALAEPGFAAGSQAPVAGDDADPTRQRPFAGLAALRRSRPPH
jgi:uncharacterized protein